MGILIQALRQLKWKFNILSKVLAMTFAYLDVSQRQARFNMKQETEHKYDSSLEKERERDWRQFN